jgi:hypothetical protein
MDKNIINQIKQEIKNDAERQKFLKNQRKTVKLVGERKMSSYDAAEELRHTSYPLFIKYIAYYICKHRLELPVFVDSATRKDYKGNSIKVLDNQETFKSAIVRCCSEKCWVLSGEYNCGWCHETEDTARQVLKVINGWEAKYGTDKKED